MFSMTMEPDYRNCLAFARGWASHFQLRAMGKDETSLRLVNVRPVDQVLSGFLTPRPIHDTDPDEAESEDLPQDSPHEQTSMGFEWLSPLEALAATSIEIAIELSVFTRIVPTKDEQERYGRWDRPPRGAESTERLMVVIPVWSRVDVGPWAQQIDLNPLQSSRRLSIDISDSLRQAVKVSLSRRNDLFPGGQSLRVPQSEFEGDFGGWLGALRPTPRHDDWEAFIDIRLMADPTYPGCGRISLRLINRTPPRDTRSAMFFDPNLYAVQISATMPTSAHRDGRFRELEESYRYDLRMPATGINCHAEQSRQKDLLTLRTNSIPTSELGRLEPREIPDATPNFGILTTDPIPVLRRIAKAMRSYDQDAWEPKVMSLSGPQQREAARDRQRFRDDEINGFERGVDLLENAGYPFVRQAFLWMNEAMGRVAQRSRHPYTEWRLFQIVFIVQQLPILAAREYPELQRDGDDRVDVLWFAAGGGKTEAFLALILWQAFFDRLRGKTLGVTAFIRFPLRLLAFQQLQRTAKALAAAELIRHREKLGGARFSLGYFVGGTQTPNSIDEELHERYSKHGVDARALRILHCPFCDSDVSAAYDSELRLLEHRCTNKSCPGGTSRLPVYIIDYDIYQYLPTVVVSTVDKLAQLGQQQRFANLFGRFDVVCTLHGASFLDINHARCSGAKATRDAPMPRPDRCGEAPLLYGPFKDPSPALLVQDELHLLSEELGTFDSHYETTILKLADSLGSKPWKIVGATATIARFEDQAEQLYLRHARQFPAPGPEAFESFYYTLDREHIGRIFVGVLGVGRKHTPAVTRTLSLLYQELQAARDLVAANLASACARYGLPSISAQEFELILYYYDLILTYVLTRKGSDQVAEAIESRVKRELADAYPMAAELRIETFNSSVDMGDMVAAMEGIESADPTAPSDERVRGLVTTNIIGHGVDVDRFNCIVFAGFTRLVAEYIQTSARVGRKFPGLSVFVATPQSERDRSIFERFAKFHEYLDRLVDPSAVTRWPVPALDRTVPGLVAGYLMAVAAAQMHRRLETVEKVQRAIGEPGATALLADAVVNWIQDALGADQAPSRDAYSAAVDRVTRNTYSRIVDGPPARDPRGTLLNRYLGTMRSLRDVDEPALIMAEDHSDTSILKALLRA